jgi:hypothetical protein
MEQLQTRRRLESAIDRLEERAEAVELKKALELEGFTLCHSIWMNIRKTSDGTLRYVRVEVWIFGRPKESTYYELKAYFEKYPPPYQYSIWAYDSRNDDLAFQRGWERW